MNLEATKKYYENLDQGDFCNCDYCKNYREKIKKSYPNLEIYLKKLGVDIEKPFETCPLEPESGILEYTLVQYVVFGNKSDFKKTRIGHINIDISEDYPSTDILEEHFVIEIGPVFLQWDDIEYEKLIEKIDNILKKKAYIIDFLPVTVSENSKGNFFDVENYFLNEPKSKEIKEKFSNIILKFMCYHALKILWNGIEDNPSAEKVDKIIRENIESHSGTVHMLFDDRLLIVFEWDCLNLSIYDSSDEDIYILEKLAQAEGLFWRKAKDF